MPTVVVCSRRDDGDWRDLAGCVQALELYSGLEVRVFWQGPAAPVVPVAVQEQPVECRSFGAAFGWAVRQVSGDVILCNDDCRVHPDTVDLLMADVELLREVGASPGMVVAHSNFARGGQQLGGLAGIPPFQMAAVSPIFGWMPRDAVDAADWPDCNWYSDDVLCADLLRGGWSCWVSRAYVDHFGERATRQHGETQGDLSRAGKAWVMEHRPDVCR